MRERFSESESESVSVSVSTVLLVVMVSNKLFECRTGFTAAQQMQLVEFKDIPWNVPVRSIVHLPSAFPPLISSYFRNNRLLWQNSPGKLISNFRLIFHFLSFAPLITPRTFWQAACTFFTNNQIKSTNYWLLDENSFCTLAYLIELYYLFNEVSLNFPENL